MREGRRNRRMDSLWRTGFAIIFMLFATAPWCRAESKEDALILPFKINAETDVERLRDSADAALNDALKAKGFAMFPRQEARKRFDYDAGWPPAWAGIQPLAVETGARYIGVGSITRLGPRLSVDLLLYDVADPDASTSYYKVSESEAELANSIRTLVGDAMANVGRYYQIAAIHVSGNARIDGGAILHNVNSQAGDRYDAAKLREDLGQVFRMGYFDDVQIEVKDTEKGKEVTFVIKEKPVVSRVMYEGLNELKEENVKEVVSVSVNKILNSKELYESAQKVQMLYKEKGYYNTQVDTQLSTPTPSLVDVRFIIKEGTKVYIKEIKVTGNKVIPYKQILKVIETSKKGLFSWFTDSGVLKREVLAQDAERIVAFYNNQGFIDSRVGEPEVVQIGEWLAITFNVFEGDRYRPGKVSFKGDLIEPEEKLLQWIKIREEEYFSRKVMREDVLRINDFYADNGYANVEVNPLINKNAADKSVDIALDIQKGALIHINRINIKGNTRTREKVVRREMAVKENGTFNASAMRKSHSRLQRLDFFEEVKITPEPTLDPDTMDVNVEVKEKPTGAFSIGGGYSSVENLMFMAEIRQSNFLGKGQQLALQGHLSSNTTRYNLSFTEPRWNDSLLSGGFDVYNWMHQYDDYTKDSTGGAVRFGYPVWEYTRLMASYGFDHSTLSDVSEDASQVIKDSEDINITSYVKLGLRRDTRDRIYDASTGSDNGISVKYAGGPLGGDSAFTKTEGSSGWYFPVWWNTTYHVRWAAGYVKENASGKLPVYEKFYLGGIENIRGFDSASISPRDPETGEKIGGDKMWFMNAEWIFPIVKDAGLKGVVFFDCGNVYDIGQDWDFDQIKKSVGLGFRWMSPLGPLRLEWGYNLDPVGNEASSNWDFSIGAPF